ncbi:MAG: DUF2065 domain-containing protein [Pseudomonadales bacterium]|nr:DUF2065 domain-containing protein [Pseudomonadales bacterium]
MWQELWIAICLVLVIEGMLPFLTPKLWRQSMLQLAQLDDRGLRIVGLISMVLGTIALYIVN